MDKRCQNIKDDPRVKNQEVKGHHDIGHICTHIHAHERIIEYKTDVQIPIMRLID